MFAHVLQTKFSFAVFGDIVNNTHESLGFRDIVTVDDDSDNDDNELLCEMVDRWKALNLISSRDHCTKNEVSH